MSEPAQREAFGRYGAGSRTLESGLAAVDLADEIPRFDLPACYRELGFPGSPFSITPDTDYFFPGSRHLEVLDHLRFGIATGGMTMLTGEVGLGKTLLCRYLLRNKIQGIRFAYLLNPDQTYEDILKSLYEDLTGKQAEWFSVGWLQRELYQVLLHLAAEGERVAVLVDEAHRLTADVLQGLRLLSNLDTEKEKLLCLLFVGQPEFERTLAQEDLRPLAQRISVRYRLRAFGCHETIQYIRHRLAVGAPSRWVRFDLSAAVLTHLLSRGVPRRINQICDRALLAAYAVGQITISSTALWRAAREVARSQA